MDDSVILRGTSKLIDTLDELSINTRIVYGMSKISELW